MRYSSDNTVVTDRMIKTEQSRPVKKRVRKAVRRTFYLLLFILLFTFVNRSDFMNVRNIKIIAGDGINPAEVNNRFNLQDYAGMNLLWVPYGMIEWLLDSHPEIASSRVVPWPPGEITITLTHEEPDIYMIRPWGYYVLGKNSQFIETLPPYGEVADIPIKLSDEHMLFDESGHPLPDPWRQMLAKDEIDNRNLMLALGFRDLLTLRDIVRSQQGIPNVQYVGYHERYGLMLKCEGEPLILIGYGDDLMIHFTRALKILSDTNFPFSEDKYVDIRFDEYQCVVDIDKLEGFSTKPQNTDSNKNDDLP